jgi:hypothetical protein
MPPLTTAATTPIPPTTDAQTSLPTTEGVAIIVTTEHQTTSQISSTTATDARLTAQSAEGGITSSTTEHQIETTMLTTPTILSTTRGNCHEYLNKLLTIKIIAVLRSIAVYIK